MIHEGLISPDKQAALVALCRRYFVVRLELFGSATSDSFDPAKSDLDFLVSFAPCTPVEHYDRYFGFVESLESMFGRAVDLVETSAIRNPYFIQQVSASRKLLYAA